MRIHPRLEAVIQNKAEAEGKDPEAALAALARKQKNAKPYLNIVMDFIRAQELKTDLLSNLTEGNPNAVYLLMFGEGSRNGIQRALKLLDPDYDKEQ